MTNVVVSGGFGDLRSPHIRFLEEASKLGDLHVLLWSDERIQALDGMTPKFPEEERLYFLQAIRYIQQVTLVTDTVDRDALPPIDGAHPDNWVVHESDDTPAKRAYCRAHDIEYQVLRPANIEDFPDGPTSDGDVATDNARKKVLVTGCFDWLHSGHVRFFEETSELGDLYVVVGHDQNIELLKGPGHPQFHQDERRYMVQAIRYVKQALISTGHGWMDAAPEITRIKPDMYAVNEDGDKPEKAAFCKEHGLEYVVLKRTPKAGLPRRASTDLRGF